MQKLFFFLIPVFLITIPLLSHGDEESGAQNPAVYAVQMHADWCGACKALDPKVAQARLEAELDNQDVLFVKLDLTNDITKVQASMMAAALGIGDVYDKNAGKTGFMLIINAATGERITRITNKFDAEAIAAKVVESLKAVKA